MIENAERHSHVLWIAVYPRYPSRSRVVAWITTKAAPLVDSGKYRDLFVPDILISLTAHLLSLA